MGQIKGNPAADRSYQNQLYTEKYGSGNAPYRDMGTKPVMIDDNTTLNDVVDITFETDAVAAMVSASVNTTLLAVSSSINTTLGAVSSSINTTLGAVSSSISSSINLTISVPGTYANDAAAQAAGVRIGGLYHTTGTVKVRLV